MKQLLFPKPVLRDTEDPRRRCRHCGKPFVKSRLSSTLCRECAEARLAKRQKRRSMLRRSSGRLKGRNNCLRERDEAEKILRGYTDPRSYVRTDGSERLFGVDWEKRVEEVFIRCEGRCERVNDRGERCGSDARDPHHKVKRSRYRDDRAENLRGLCGEHHSDEHPEFQTQFGETEGTETHEVPDMR